MEFFWEMLSLQETMFLLILTGVLIKKLKIIVSFLLLSIPKGAQ